ncbi:hypothetical protein ALQ57_02752 [Pseudomonas amygdali pv. hibisci]|uniref:Lipoprotein n=1 Tax=Pseudomonas amygdali pv. hibisci TaxID=251723 RepID=A0AB34UGY1_PSEA0|nr:hypothetical protein [Pseudomonas amygdali]KPX59429.1 Uncharacterized protein ALO67_03494 [Pseudomonas amygdali pv. hibisci]RMN59510.1 hypothetical protein ALQ57_02752 [Pseudomonas amygdali pv. hibisci]
MFKKIALSLFIFSSLAGCNIIASKTNVLDDEKVKSIGAGALGYSPEDLILVNRRTDGTNTYANFKTNDKKEFVCIINGGNITDHGHDQPAFMLEKG